jgi:hypothetical protein
MNIAPQMTSSAHQRLEASHSAARSRENAATMWCGCSMRY